LTTIIKNYAKLSIETKSVLVDEVMYLIFLKNKWSSLDESKKVIMLNDLAYYCKATINIIDNYLTPDGKIKDGILLDCFLKGIMR